MLNHDGLKAPPESSPSVTFLFSLSPLPSTLLQPHWPPCCSSNHEHIPTSGPLHLQCPPPGMLCPSSSCDELLLPLRASDHMLPPGSHSGRIWRGVCSGRVCCAWQGALCGLRLGAKRVETESDECKGVQVERWVGLGEPGQGRRCQKERLEAGLERVLTIGVNNLGSMQRKPCSPILAPVHPAHSDLASPTSCREPQPISKQEMQKPTLSISSELARLSEEVR